MIRHDQLYIGGAWVPCPSREVIEVVSPSTEEVIATVPAGSSVQVDAAVTAARAAFESWSATSPAERAEVLQRIHEGLKARAPEIARTISSEMGMPLHQALRIQVGTPVASFKLYAELARSFAFEEEVGHSRVLREAVGVVAAITPWNYPLHQIAAKVGAALAAGCTLVLKPSEVAPLNAFLLAEVIHEAGLPPGVFNLVTGYGGTVGEALVAHPDVDMISFTGSTLAGKRISEVAAHTVKRVSLELGGKSAAVVLDDADLAAAVHGTVANCFMNAGQTCTAHTRLLVPRARLEEACALAVEAAADWRVGDPFDERSQLGPVASALQRERVRHHIRAGVEAGGRLLCGGPDAPIGLERGYYVSPTIFADVRPDARIAQEEVFGPVLVILPYEDENDAVRIANGTVYGLSGGVWSATEERAVAVARRLRTGQVNINGGGFNLKAPFGGYKQSGHGRELGVYGLEEFLEYKSLQFKR
ncbi:aldehyde dehydrogenase family protein [Aquabacterium sp. A7-Y]|uniref:aldehyde dehydrogenase family protein n=1 Tax=Aquabacterium sp. A7-Y TaxID=1349605 RepID=UPI00223CB6B1|nr:aldehyde dehydrogenase family protein [Aquabacterium sp. A7-Y]MCW7537328.1 aldehyde dehydrogenase family protein [Aquabacterium sp. A7-Y]